MYKSIRTNFNDKLVYTNNYYLLKFYFEHTLKYNIFKQ